LFQKSCDLALCERGVDGLDCIKEIPKRPLVLYIRSAESLGFLRVMKPGIKPGVNVLVLLPDEEGPLPREQLELSGLVCWSKLLPQGLQPFMDRLLVLKDTSSSARLRRAR
jgi:hypothetical protein